MFRLSKNFTPEILGECPQITKDQKKAFVILICFIIAMLGSSVTFLGPFYKLMNKLGVMGIATVAMFVTLLMKKENGKSFINVHEPAQWSIILITALVMVLSTFMMSPDYGVTATISMIIQPLMNLSPYVFIIITLLIAVILTHFATNMVLCIVMMPFMVTIASSIGMTPTGIIALLFFSCQMSLATPGGGAPVSALFYGITEYVKPNMMSKYGVIAILFLFLFDIILGLSWASIIFGA